MCASAPLSGVDSVLGALLGLRHRRPRRQPRVTALIEARVLLLSPEDAAEPGAHGGEGRNHANANQFSKTF